MTYEFALDDLAFLVVPRRLIPCQGNAGEDGIDGQCNNQISDGELHNSLFVSDCGKSQDKVLVPVIQAIAASSEELPLTDRDRHDDTGRTRARQESRLMLKLRELENYLLDDEILENLCKKVGRQADTAHGTRSDRD